MNGRPWRSRAALVTLAAVTLQATPGAAQRTVVSRAEIDRAVRVHLPVALGSYGELLRFPNDAHHADDLERQTRYLAERFEALGFDARVLPTAGLPILLAERRVPGATRTVLVYLQSDGQPVDPSAWSQPDPYEPVVKRRKAAGGDGWEVVPWETVEAAVGAAGDGAGGTALDPEWRLFARSASDSKGPVAQFLAALRIAGDLGVEPDFDLKVVVDTEEELGSPALPDAVRRHRDALASDMLVIFDGPPHASGRPTLKFGARGIATVTLTTYGPRAPQHSGHYGNYAPNPALRMARILASLKDEHGRVVIPGWYDGV
ncbi:MAG: M20/M25/M40 family metallo-hydrolase, partial [Gemmatimonadota bacterium]